MNNKNLEQNTRLLALKEIIKFSFKHTWLINILFFGFGILVFIGYFWIKYQYVPILEWGELFTVLIKSTTIFVLLPMILALVLYAFVYMFTEERKQDKFKKSNFIDFCWIGFYKSSLFLFIVSFILTFISLPIFNEIFNIFEYKDINQIVVSDLIFFLFILIIFIIFIYILLSLIIRYKPFRFFMLVVSLVIIMILSLGCLENYFLFPFFIFTSLLVLWSIFIEKTSKQVFKVSLLLGLLVILISLTFVFVYPIFKVLNYSGVKYKSIILDKKVVDILPKNLDKNISDNSVKINDITVISSLGKFYYMETKSKQRFEIKSEYVLGKEIYIEKTK